MGPVGISIAAGQIECRGVRDPNVRTSESPTIGLSDPRINDGGGSPLLSTIYSIGILSLFFSTQVWKVWSSGFSRRLNSMLRAPT